MANIGIFYLQRSMQVCSSNYVKVNVVGKSSCAQSAKVLSCYKLMCNEAKHSEDTSQTGEISLPEEPTTCCMSGCANCVWIQYAEEMSKFYEDGGEKAKEVILSKVTDPNTRAFLMMELKNLTDKPL